MADLHSYIIVFLIWPVSTILVRYITRTRTKGRVPPSPLALPIIGHLHLLAPLPHQALHKLSNRFGPLIHLFLGSVPFGQTQTLDQLLPVRHEEITRFVQFILKKAQSDEAIDVGEGLMRVTNNTISRMTMSQRCSENENEADEVTKLVKATAELTGKFNLSDYICKNWFCKNLDLQGFGKRLKEVRDRFDSHAVKDLLHILLDISEDKSSEMRLTRENIKAFVLDIFAAGTDASAITTEWALAELINHPNIMEKARQEIDFVVGKMRLVEESDIVNLPYLQAIVKETLRLHPTGPVIVRESSKCLERNFVLPPKIRLHVNVWVIGKDPNHWENPLEFQPNRLISEENGRRGYPRTSLALQVFQTTLATLIQRFEWKVSGGKGTIDMEEGPGLTLPRAHPLICVLVTRLNPFPST
ncbi:hypothetical protein RGQ29_025010 [Quercus rubra]|uniref:Cytochrome P450 n=1 Tax=Quercus rubra TaxID=3512 RepID=A0AAN7EY09_QUERU|nr:hypothetical protein RGQ29_025010 [Quercus rubra]